MTHTACIGVGSNIDPWENIAKARDLMQQAFAGFRTSQFVTTPPIGSTDQNDYLNGAFAIATDWTQDSLNAWLKSAEQQLGRVRTTDKYAPRTIDLDVVVWDGKIVDMDFYERDFVKQAVLELFPDLRY